MSDPVFTDCRRDAGSFAAWPRAVPDEAGRLIEAARIEVISAAEWRWTEGRSVARRRTPTTILGLHDAGSGRIRLDGRPHRIASPCLLTVPAGRWHDVRHDPGRPLASVSVHVEATLPGGGNLTEALGFPVVLAIDPVGVDRPLVEALTTLARLDARRPPGWRVLARAEAVRALMHVALHHGLACRPIVAGPAVPVRLAAALALIERDVTNGPVQVAELAAAAGVSAVRLRTLFRRATGTSPHRYVQNRRIALACRLLREDAAPVADIAARVGLAGSRSFHRLFRACTGTTPGAWRDGI